MNNKRSVEILAAELRELNVDERWQRVRDLPISTLVQLLGVKWRLVGDYAWDALRGHSERAKVHHAVIDALMRAEFRRVDARVRALSLLTAEAARSESAKAVYRKYLNDPSSGVVGCAAPGSVWSLDREAIPIMRRVLARTSDDYLKKDLSDAIEAIETGDPRIMSDAARDPVAWGLSLPSKSR
jgi:hypothetical protein